MFSDDENCNVVKLIAALAYTYKNWMGSEFRHTAYPNKRNKVSTLKNETKKEHFHYCFEGVSFTTQLV